MSPEGLLLLLLGVLAWFWWDSLQKREIALTSARLACDRAGDEERRARFYREFAFEYSSQGDDRQAGRVWLLGARVVNVVLVEQNVVPFPTSNRNPG